MGMKLCWMSLSQEKLWALSNLRHLLIHTVRMSHCAVKLKKSQYSSRACIIVEGWTSAWGQSQAFAAFGNEAPNNSVSDFCSAKSSIPFILAVLFTYVCLRPQFSRMQLVTSRKRHSLALFVISLTLHVLEKAHFC